MKAQKSSTASFLDNGGSVYMLADVDLEDVEAIYHYAIELMQAEEFQQAKRLLYFLVTLNHWNFDYCFYLSDCFYRLGEYQKALHYLTRCVEIDLSDPRIYFKAGYIYEVLNNPERAQENFEMAMKWSLGRKSFLYIENASKQVLAQLASKNT